MNLGEPPTDYQGLKDRVQSRRGVLPKRMLQVADYLLERPEDVAFGTAASVAVSAGVVPSALVRFGQLLGLNGFSDLQRLCRGAITARPGVGRRQRGRALAGVGAVSQAIAGQVAAFADICSQRVELVLQTAARRLVAADMIYVVATGRSYPLGLLAAAAFGDAGMRSQVVSHLDPDVGALLSLATDRDAVISVNLGANEGSRGWLSSRSPDLAILGSHPPAGLFLEVVVVGEGPFGSGNALAVIDGLCREVSALRSAHTQWS